MSKGTNITQEALFQALGSLGRPMTVLELITHTGKSRVSVQKELKKLVAEDRLERLGTPPRVYYALRTESPVVALISLPPDQAAYIQEYFNYIDPTGREFPGVVGFQLWCQARRIDPVLKAPEFVATHNQYQELVVGGVIDASSKLRSTFGASQALDHLYFLHPYSIPVFGKTKLAGWLFTAKQTQDIHLLNRVLDMVIPQISEFIQSRGYSAIAFVPPTVPREVQIMDLMASRLRGLVQVIPVVKTPRPIRIQQKSLKDLHDRIDNARATLLVPVNALNLSKVLIVDDFTGSGSTLNVLASILKRQGVAEYVDGLTITGSMNGFDVVKEI